MSVGYQAIPLDHSYEWLHAAPVARPHVVDVPGRTLMLLLLPRDAVAAPTGSAPPAATVRMRLRMHVGAVAPEGTTTVCAHFPCLVM